MNLLDLLMDTRSHLLSMENNMQVVMVSDDGLHERRVLSIQY